MTEIKLHKGEKRVKVQVFGVEVEIPIKDKLTTLKRRPKRIDVIIPFGSIISVEGLPMGTYYVQEGDDTYWKVELNIARRSLRAARRGVKS